MVMVIVLFIIYSNGFINSIVMMTLLLLLLHLFVLLNAQTRLLL